MSRKARCPLGSRLRRIRALAVCLGERSFVVRPLDRSCGRPSSNLTKWPRTYKLSGDYEDQSSDDLLEKDPISFVFPDCVNYLNQAGLCRSWFQIEERAKLLGAPVSVHVRSYDFLVTAGSLFDSAPRNCVFIPRNDSGEPCRRASFASISSLDLSEVGSCEKKIEVVQ